MKTHIKLTIGAMSVLAMIGANWYYTPRSASNIHYHAGFRVYVDGVRQDYSDYKYMNFVPCTEHDTKKTQLEEQVEKAHLHDGIGDVVHVHRSGAVWGDLFKNIGVKLDGNLEILTQPIGPNSSIVISVGKPVVNPEKVSLEQIKEIEAKSELCGDDKQL